MAGMIYANARAKALEKSLIGEERMNRMLDALSAEDALRILTEVNFGEGVALDSVMDFERLIDAEQTKFFSFLREDSSPKTVAEFFMLKNDFHNVEAFVKSKYLKKDLGETTVDGGTLDKVFLKECVMNDEYGTLPDCMRQALLKADEVFTSGKADGAIINALFVKAYYEQLHKVAEKDEQLKKIYTFTVDCINIGVALRMRNYVGVKDFLLPYGKLTDSNIHALSEDALENLKEMFKFTDYKEAVAVAVEEKIKGQALSGFEKFTDEYALKLLSKRRFEIEGNIPFLLYAFTKVAEIKNVRIILVGLINGIDRKEIKSKLRKIYER